MDTTLADADYNLYLLLKTELEQAQDAWNNAQNRLSVARYAFDRFDEHITRQYNLADHDMIEPSGRIRRGQAE